jgi:hypothetical protein
VYAYDLCLFFLGICVYSSQRASTCMYEVVGAPDWLEGVWYTHTHIYTRGAWGVCGEVLRGVLYINFNTTNRNYRQCKHLPSQ